ncbi:NUDIX domain-containing protein [Muriicola soli]|uniref:NUDIX domain-containing protein n=2 Tax=Muriicola soli TaxID=2507538 RepID=A0A411EDF3_9FLAO|nr:NUDIX domain-containing protein [Muriicola soli]
MLTRFGRGIDSFLDVIDPNHSLNSIDYYIEPSPRIIDKLAWVHIENKRILCVRSKGKVLFYIPGGKREKGESDLMALSREILEELQVRLDTRSFTFLENFEAQADGKPAGILVRMRCYESSYQGKLKPASEIAEMQWLGYNDREKVSKVAQLVFDYLKNEGRL